MNEILIASLGFLSVSMAVMAASSILSDLRMSDHAKRRDEFYERVASALESSAQVQREKWRYLENERREKKAVKQQTNNIFGIAGEDIHLGSTMEFDNETGLFMMARRTGEKKP